MGGLIFMMLPTYIGFTAGAGVTAIEAQSNNPMFEVLGLDIEFMVNPVGMFSFLCSFFTFAAAIHGMSMAFSSHTKEYNSKSAEFLLTKPQSRSKVFWGKFLACATGSLIVGAAFMIGAALALLTIKDASVDWWAFFLIAKTLFLTELMFAVFGMFAGTVFSNTRMPTLISSCVMLALFGLNSMSRLTNMPILGYLTPFSFFKPLDIFRTGFYEWNFVVWYVVLGAGLLLISHKKFLKKDIVFAG